MEKFDNTINRFVGPALKNDYVSAILSIILILYAALVAPAPPLWIAKLMDHWFVKIIFFALIALLFGKKPMVALIAAIAVLVTLLAIDRIKFQFEFMNNVDSIKGGRFSATGCTCSCHKMHEAEVINETPGTDTVREASDEVIGLDPNAEYASSV